MNLEKRIVQLTRIVIIMAIVLGLVSVTLFSVSMYTMSLSGWNDFQDSRIDDLEEQLSSYAGADISLQISNRLVALDEEIANLNFEVFDTTSESWEYNSPANSRMDEIQWWLNLWGDYEENRLRDIMNLEADMCYLINELEPDRETLTYCMPWYEDMDRIRYDQISFNIEDLDTVQELVEFLDTGIESFEELQRDYDDLFFKVWYMWEELYLFDSDFTDSPETDADGNYMSFSDFTIYGFTNTYNIETMVEDGWRYETSRLDALFADMYLPPTFVGDYNDSWDYNIVDDNITALQERVTALELVIQILTEGTE